jgi:transmembrane sensor
MMSNDDRIRAAIAEQAGDWFVASDAAPLDERDAAALVDWLKSSPLHVEQFLGVSAVARDLRQAASDPAYALDELLALARADDDAPIPLRPRHGPAAAPVAAPRRWRDAAVALVACTVLGLGLLSIWNARPGAPAATPESATALHVQTRHGEQLSQRLADGSLLHLNTDSSVTVRYGSGERLVVLDAGQADFEVAHEAGRAFRVIAGSAQVIDVGTKFDVRLEAGATVVTVVEGQVLVERPTAIDQPRAPAAGNASLPVIELHADQQISVAAGRWPVTPIAVDAQRTTAWLHRQIVFEKEPLQRVAAEFNRYAPKPIEIVSPALRGLEISGVFATDDTEAFIAFLRSLKGVRVEVTAARISVFQDTAAAAHGFT